MAHLHQLLLLNFLFFQDELATDRGTIQPKKDLHDQNGTFSTLMLLLWYQVI